MPSWGDLLGKGSIAEQLLVWGVLNQLVGDLLGPTFEVIRQDTNDAQPVAVPTPPELADQVVRGIIDPATATAVARKNGLGAEDFNRAVEGAGEPPGLEFVLEALRRGFIGVGEITDTGPSLLNAVAKSRVYSYWADVIEKMADRPISVGDAINSTLRHQAPEGFGLSEAYANGINSERFQVLLDTAGRPPGPSELVEMVRRGKIPLHGTGPGVLSLDQGIAEGDTKDKWTPIYEDLVTYYPPPRTITTLLSHGAITEDQAAQLFTYAGLSADLAHAYVVSATTARLAPHRDLAESAVLALYVDHLIDRQAALNMLGDLGYDGAEAGYILEVQDFVRERRALDSAVTRVQSLYVGRHITRASAVDALTALDIPDATRTQLVNTWDAERAASVKTLTAAQIESAVYYQIKPQAWGQQRLEELGYTPEDAWIALSVRLKGASGNAPPPGPNPGEATPVGE